VSAHPLAALHVRTMILLYMALRRAPSKCRAAAASAERSALTRLRVRPNPAGCGEVTSPLFSITSILNATSYKTLRDKSPHNRVRRLTPQGRKRTLSVRKPAGAKAAGAMTARLPCKGGGAAFRQYGDNRLIIVLAGSQSLFGSKGRLIAVVRANH